jgi:hypothetical protein
MMTEAQNRPAGRRRQAQMMRVVNVPMRLALSLPFATPLGDRLMLAHLTGRKTGKHYRQPLSYVRQDDSLLTPGGGRWKLNLESGRPERLRLRGRDVRAWPEIIGDVDEINRLLQVMIQANPRVKSFVGIPQDPDGTLDREQLATAVRYGFRVVRWHLDEPR